MPELKAITCYECPKRNDALTRVTVCYMCNKFGAASGRTLYCKHILKKKKKVSERAQEEAS